MCPVHQARGHIWYDADELVRLALAEREIVTAERLAGFVVGTVMSLTQLATQTRGRVKRAQSLFRAGSATTTSAMPRGTHASRCRRSSIRPSAFQHDVRVSFPRDVQSVLLDALDASNGGLAMTVRDTKSSESTMAIADEAWPRVDARCFVGKLRSCVDVQELACGLVLLSSIPVERNSSRVIGRSRGRLRR